MKICWQMIPVQKKTTHKSKQAKLQYIHKNNLLWYKLKLIPEILKTVLPGLLWEGKVEEEEE